MKITIAGLPGSGKTTVAKMIAKRLNCGHYSIGDLRGEIAAKHDMSLAELNEVGLREEWPHKEADDFLKELGEAAGNLVIDTWMGFHFIPDSFKVFISVDAESAAKRIFGDLVNRSDEDYDSVEEVKEGVRKRVEVSDQAYQKYYNVSFLDQSHYDLILDSTDKSAEEIMDIILDSIPGEGRYEDEGEC
jgi:cytidylate kinase